MRDAFQAPFKIHLLSCFPVVNASAADFRLLRELSFLMSNECVWDVCPQVYFDTSWCFQASLDVCLMRADVVCI